jgi:hypothetical protein
MPFNIVVDGLAWFSAPGPPRRGRNITAIGSNDAADRF